MKKVSLGVTIAVAALSAAVAVTASYRVALQQFNQKLAAFNERQLMYQKLNETDTLARQEFFGEIREETLQNALCDGYMAGLDDEKAAYYTPAAYKVYQAEQSTLRTDAGLDVAELNGKLYVTRVQENGPATETELQPGDILMAVNGQKVTTAQEAETLLRGEEGDIISIKARRGGNIMLCEVNAEIYAAQSVFSRVVDRVGIVQITGFYNETAEEFSNALQALETRQVKALVLDLRGCSRGTAANMQPIADVLLSHGPTVRYIDRDGQTVEQYSSDMASNPITLQVLLDGYTSGAAELLAGAIQDFARGTLVGTQTAGDGRYVQVTQLSDGSAIALTVGMYIRADGTTVQDMGIYPEKEVPVEEKIYAQQRCGLLSDEDDEVLQSALQGIL